MTCGTSLHRGPRTKPMPSAVEACRFNNWTTRKVLSFLFQRSWIIILKKKKNFPFHISFLLDSILADKMKTDFLLVQLLLVHYSSLEHMCDAWGLAVITKYGRAQDKRDWFPWWPYWATMTVLNFPFPRFTGTWDKEILYCFWQSSAVLIDTFIHSISCMVGRKMVP